MTQHRPPAHWTPGSPLAQVMLHPESVLPAYQPIVDLDDDRVVGFEALARWPVAGEVDPVSVFDHARTLGVLHRVDWACRLAAIQGAVDAGMGVGCCLFVNFEPDALNPVRAPAPARAASVFGAAAAAGIQLVIELTERALLADPSAVLDTVRIARTYHHAIALDDLGVSDDSLAMLTLVAPDVVKLDRCLIHDRNRARTTSVFPALTSYIECSDVCVVAEGIETVEHLRAARDWGAHLGQGRLFGTPGPLPVLFEAPRSRAVVPTAAAPAPDLWSATFGTLVVRTGDAEVLARLIGQLLDKALTHRQVTSVLATFPGAADFTPELAARFGALAAEHPLVAVSAPGLGDRPAHGVRGSASVPESSVPQWVVAIVGNESCVALIARECAIGGVHSAGTCRPVEYVLSYDRDCVIGAARTLARSINPL